MLDLRQYNSLGEALRAALERWPDEVCLIEADRDRENARFTYRQFKQAALPLARALQNAGFQRDSRAAIVMSNQSKWLISAYAIFYAGGVLVPLDYKLSAAEQLQLLAHSKSEVLVVEYHLWRAITQAGNFKSLAARLVLVAEAPAGADLVGAKRWENFRDSRLPIFVPRKRRDPACIVYSSGTGGRPKGCVLTHENYLEQCRALTALFPFSPGTHYLSILPTNHAIDFMVGFIGPFTCGATVVHLRTLRPEYIRDAFTRYKIAYMTVVPVLLKTLERGLRQRFDELPGGRRRVLRALIAINRLFTRRKPRLKLSRQLLAQVHKGFGGELRALFVGGAFTEPATLQFFYDLGIPVGNGYGCTEAGTVITLNDFNPFRPDTVGKPLPGIEVNILDPDDEGVGEVAVRGSTVMSHYLDDPEMTAETIVDGWLRTGDLGRVDKTGHLQLLGRKKNMIVTEEGKNVYPEDIEAAFEGLAVKEFCVFAANYLWPERTMTGEQLILVVHPEAKPQIQSDAPGESSAAPAGSTSAAESSAASPARQIAVEMDSGPVLASEVAADIDAHNRRLINYKRVSGYLVWDCDFPRTASMKIKRLDLAERIRGARGRHHVVYL
ncbi:MAG: AMP-binding protein [Acidobacteriota bacterium]|nr:AMP-binding protein [Acidobacteriota bacterium]